MDCIDKQGLSQTTLARIAERAGVSQGNVVFHFQNKETLLEQTLRHLSEEYRANWLDALDKAAPDNSRPRSIRKSATGARSASGSPYGANRARDRST